MATHIILGKGHSTSNSVVTCLADALSDGDTLAMEWTGTPIPEAMEAAYGYAIDHEVPFTLFYMEGQKVPEALKSAETITVQKVRSSKDSLLKVLDGNILFLWDEQEAYDLLDYVWDNVPDATILELSNGLAPIVGTAEEPTPLVNVQEEEEDIPATFTREELEIATAHVVKRYGERLGCTAKTKSGIIAELFPEVPAHTATAPVEDIPEIAPAPETKCVTWDLDTLTAFYYQKPEGWVAEMAHAKIAEATLWAARALDEVPKG
jgi:hypothetical protein